jgi:hypothetical protein
MATLRTANAHGTEPHARKSLGAPNKVFHIKVSDDRSVNAPVDDRHRLKTEPVPRQKPQADKDNPL